MVGPRLQNELLISAEQLSIQYFYILFLYQNGHINACVTL